MTTAAPPAPAQEQALATTHGSDPTAPSSYAGGLMLLAAMSDDQFKSRLSMLKAGQDRMRLIQKELLQPDVDYGDVTDGDNRPTLLKPGAEKLFQIYGLAPDEVHEIIFGDGQKEPPVTVIARCPVHLRDLNGPIIAVGVGACTSWEKKYRWRKGGRSCPKCGVDGSIIQGKVEYAPKGNDGGPLEGFEKGGWLCWKKATNPGCGATFEDRDPKIVNQNVAPQENPDQVDLLNTIVKIAKKRAYVDGCLNATATSGLFGQDLEDLDEAERERIKAEGAARADRKGQGQQKPGQHAQQKAGPKPAAAPAGKPAAAPPAAQTNGDTRTPQQLVDAILATAEKYAATHPQTTAEEAIEHFSLITVGDTPQVMERGKPSVTIHPPKWLRLVLDRLEKALAAPVAAAAAPADQAPAAAATEPQTAAPAATDPA
jgi:hypothetical protein